MTVYLADPRQAARVLAAARAVDPTVDRSLVRFQKAAAARAALDAAAQTRAHWRTPGGCRVRVDMVRPAADASRLELDVDEPAAAPAACGQHRHRPP